MIARLLLVVSFLCAGAMHAQQLDIFDPDDFVDPSLIGGRVIFISRLVAGVARGQEDQYRRVGQDVGYVHLANSLYWRGFQFDLKRSEVRGEHDLDDPPERPLRRFEERDEPPPVPGAKTTAQLSWYQTFGDDVTLRYRYLYARQYAVPETAANIPGLESHDDTQLLQLDAGWRVRGRMRFATLTYGVLTRHSTVEERKQRTLALAAFLPLLQFRSVVLTPRVQWAAIRDSGPAVDLVNPSLDLTFHIERAATNVHFVYSPVVRFGSDATLRHQIAIYADRALLVHVFGGHEP